MARPTLDPVAMLERLVAFDTTSANSNLDLIEFGAEHLRTVGCEPELVFDETGAKANLIGTIGPDRAGGVVLSGHTDVVPVAGQSWATDPFRLTQRNGRLYGRGTADMKAFLAVGLALAPEFAAADLLRPVHFALSYDEEVGCLGVRRMIPALAGGTATPAAVIVGEPTGMRVVTAHKGIRTFRTTVTGVEAHSSAPASGVNAIYFAAKAISFLRSEARRLAAEGAAANSGYTPPVATISVGTIEGGTALNIVPKTCTFTWECRVLPGANAEAIPDSFHRFIAEELLPAALAESPFAAIVTEPTGAVPAFDGGTDSPAATLALKLAGSNRTERVAYGSEAGLFQESGLSTVLCGPGDIADAHKPNESLAITQLDACVAFHRRLIEHLTAAR